MTDQELVLVYQERSSIWERQCHSAAVKVQELTERVKKLEHALREGIRVVTMMEKALRSCQEIIEDYCECDMCCQLRDTIKGVLNAQAISHDNT